MPADAAGQRVALVAAATSGFLTPFMGSAVTIALPAIAAEFRLGAVWLGWVTSAFLLAAAALRLPFGPLTDIVGRRRVFIAGLVVFTVATLLCAIAPSGEVLIALRLLQGAGGALIFGTGTAILTSVYPRARLGRALGIAVACVDLGLALARSIRGRVADRVGRLARDLPLHRLPRRRRGGAGRGVPPRRVGRRLPETSAPSPLLVSASSARTRCSSTRTCRARQLQRHVRRAVSAQPLFPIHFGAWPSRRPA